MVWLTGTVKQMWNTHFSDVTVCYLNINAALLLIWLLQSPLCWLLTRSLPIPMWTGDLSAFGVSRTETGEPDYTECCRCFRVFYSYMLSMLYNHLSQVPVYYLISLTSLFSFPLPISPISVLPENARSRTSADTSQWTHLPWPVT